MSDMSLKRFQGLSSDPQYKYVHSTLWAKVRQKTHTVMFCLEEIGPDGHI